MSEDPQEPIEWEEIREHFIECLDKQGITQHEVARVGGLSGQNAVSKLVNNTYQGPSVETFVRAVVGLGMSLSDFFAGFEGGRRHAVAARPTVSRRRSQSPSANIRSTAEGESLLALQREVVDIAARISDKLADLKLLDTRDAASVRAGVGVSDGAERRGSRGRRKRTGSDAA